MNPYSHLAIAAQLEAEIQPVDVSEYYWGAIAPDVRYAAGTRRAQTHIPPERVLSFFTKYPQLQSFTQGYLVHILTDLLKFRALLEQRILLWPLWLIFSGRVSTVLLETYYVERMPRRFDISGAPNSILRELGIPDEHAYAFAETLRPFVADPSPHTALAFCVLCAPPAAGWHSMPAWSTWLNNIRRSSHSFFI